MDDHSIRVLTDRGWEELGKDRFAGLTPSPPQVQSDPGGFAGASFLMPVADPGLPQPDLSSFAECEIDHDGIRIFEGRVAEAPVQGLEHTVSVQGRGWQYAKDENPVSGLWVDDDLSGWQDAREFTGARIIGEAGAGAKLGGAASVSAGDGLITFGYNNGVPWPVGATVGVTRDFGPDPNHWPKSVVFVFQRVGGPSVVRPYCRCHDEPGDFDAPEPPANSDDGLPAAAMPTLNTFTTVPTYLRARFITRRRYVSVFLKAFSAYTPTAEDVIKVSKIVAFGDYAHERVADVYTGSGLRASTVLADVYRRTPGLAVPVVEPEEFADEATALTPLTWHRGRASDVGTATDLYVIRNASGAPSHGLTGPLKSGEPTFYSAFDGVDDGLMFGVGSLFDFTMFVLFRTSQAAPAGTEWPNGRGLFDGLATAVINDFGIQIVAGGKLSAGVYHGATGAITPPRVVNDGLWHTALFRRRRTADGDADASFIELAVDTVSVVSEEERKTGGLVMQPTTIYLGRNVNGNYATVDIAEALLIPACISQEDGFELHRAALARVTGTVKRTLLRLPAYATPAGAPKTGRGIEDDLNMYHRYRVKVGRDRTPWFYPQPSTPKYTLSGDAVDRFVDTSPSQAADAYNRALILGTRPDGRSVSLFRHAADLPGARLEKLASPALANPGGEVDASGWTLEEGLAGGVTRTTTGQRTGAGGFRIAATTVGNYLRTRQAITGTFVKDVVYVVGGYYRVGSTANAGGLGYIDNTANGPLGPSERHYISVYDLAAGKDIARLHWRDDPVRPGGDWRPFQIAFAAPYTTSTLWLRLQMVYVDFYFDDLYVARSLHHRLDRLGQVRTRTMEFGQNIDVPTGRYLADAFLTSKLRTPFAGSLPIGPGDLVTYGPAPAVVPTAALCDNVGELVHFPGLVDPDGFGPGRDGQIAGVAFDSATEIAQTAFDNTRDNLEALFARGALLRGGAS